MLKRFRVQGFRTCHDVTLDNLGHVTALIGHNGSGKTNLLRAIELFARAASAPGISADIRELWAKDTTVDVEILLGESSLRYTVHFCARLDPADVRLRETLEIIQGSKTTTLVVRDGDQVNISGTTISVGRSLSLPTLNAILPETDPLKRQYFVPLASFLNAVTYYPFDEHADARGSGALSGLLKPAYEEWLSRNRTNEPASNSIVFSLIHTYLKDKPKFDEIEQLLGPRGLGLIDNIEVQGLPANSPQLYLLSFTPRSPLRGPSRQSNTFGELSLGTRRIIRLVASLVLDDSSVMLIEHPEDGIHRGLVKKLIDLISSYANPKQVILSTHSTTVMNALQPADIRLVTIENGSTQVRPLSPKEVALAENYINEEGSLAEFIETVEG